MNAIPGPPGWAGPPAPAAGGEARPENGSLCQTSSGVPSLCHTSSGATSLRHATSDAAPPAGVNRHHGHLGMTALHRAAEAGDVEEIEALLVGKGAGAEGGFLPQAC